MPSAVLSDVRSSLSTLIRFRCVAAMVRTQSSWVRGRSSNCLGYPVGAETHGAGDRSGQGLLVGRQALLERRLDVDVREQLIHHGRRDLVSDLRIGDQLFRGRLDRVRVECLVADVAREQAEHSEERPDDDQDTDEHHSAHGGVAIAGHAPVSSSHMGY